ncbi:cytochrome B [Thiopseudomonas alkaliphila]|uniref:Cytochrome B n=1 Tax=Thiopseudomonas alkaliphila TaxID=1697053 RepID=A0A0K1XDQ8_9GAMM|nr:cytochrome b [Thiopseudomonas alkaliphila]AKX45061.1 cytochrome B [Thiopseudomonas alkaliphila]AKX48368.1 cytochrome B [Thiopseudomonas alkaliphila]AKX51229.1 cytochrome B [Thiopseudomonas alkaliphila]AKX53491.1 cytochrome B [Thiopseudomonas alkaliphila]AKX57585.1 cytochrome B [Thiopseudomonas alkaliphila]
MAHTKQAAGYDRLTITLHWLVALMVIGLFALGLWMTGLSYYDSWYRTAPDLHKSFGSLLLLLMLLRLIWRVRQPRTAPIATHQRWELILAKAVQGLLYLGLFTVLISGYLISTADGRPISFFGLFDWPVLISGLPNQADIAGTVHLYAAWSVIVLAALHALAAIKHHLIDRDATLSRMLGKSN